MREEAETIQSLLSLLLPPSDKRPLVLGYSRKRGGEAGTWRCPPGPLAPRSEKVWREHSGGVPNPTFPSPEAGRLTCGTQGELRAQGKRGTLRRPPKGCRAYTSRFQNPRARAPRPGNQSGQVSPEQRGGAGHKSGREEESAVDSGDWGAKQDARGRAVWSEQRTACSGEGVGGSMQRGRGQYGLGGRWSPRGVGGSNAVGGGSDSSLWPRREA